MIRNDIGNIIKTHRLKSNFTQAELASILSVTPSAISKWESGKNIPDIEMLYQLAHELSIPPETINLQQPISSSPNSTSAPFSLFYVSFVLGLILIISLTLNIIALSLIKPRHQVLPTPAPPVSNGLVINGIAKRIVYEKDIEEPIYEVAFYSNSGPDILFSDHNFLNSMQTTWKNDNSISSIIRKKRILLYNDETDAQNWEPTSNSIILVR